MSKYFDGYASFDYKEMSKEKLITELKEKVRYIGEIKRNNNEEIAKVQSARDKTIANLETELKQYKQDAELIGLSNSGLAKMVTEKTHQIADLEAKLAESEKKLNQYPYKNEVIEEQYEDLKNGIKFRIKNNINDDLEQHYHCIDVLCEKHKARIRDIENSISAIDQLKQQLAEKDKTINEINKEFVQAVKDWKSLVAEKDKELEELKFMQRNIFPLVENLEKKINQDKISFCIEQLEKMKEIINTYNKEHCFLSTEIYTCNKSVEIIDNQIEELKKRRVKYGM